MLAVTVFLTLVCVYTNRNNGLTVTSWSDNQELIRRLTDHKSYEHPFPNETTKSEYDIIEQIYRTSCAYNFNTDYAWVNVHQDDGNNVEDLPKEA